ncbi:MAG: DUF2238 domain-containing protein [Paludibacteraceae bacterium]|nr:DUF2238 domain-containing protein [Paludibacteraceae bacterium]
MMVFTVESSVLKDKDFRMYLWVLLLCVLTVFGSYDPTVWLLEVAPALLGILTILILIARGVHFPPFLNAIFIIHAFILTVGGYFSYARVPLFNPDDFLGQTLGWTRNNYDKLGHFMQGFTPYLACRQLLAVRGVRQTGFFPIFLAVSVSLAVSALYELIEYSTCVFSVDGADDFVGSQGDPFDTQTDMLGAFIGALAAVFIFLKFRWRTNLNSCDETGR